MKKWLILFIFLATSCADDTSISYPCDVTTCSVPVFVISHGWHVGIVIESNYITQELPVHDRLPNAKYLMFGWGDYRYFTDKNAGLRLMLRAALLPTESVIHVTGINRPLEEYFRFSTIVKVMTSMEGIKEMSKFVANQFYISNNKIEVAADGLYPNSTFFMANDSYYFPNTSNKWTARALQKAGYPISPFYSVTSGYVIKQAAKHGEIIQE